MVNDVLLLHLSPEAEAGLSVTEAPPSEAPQPTTDGSEPEPPMEETPAPPSEREEEQPISSTITLLDKEEETDEEREKGGHHQQGPNQCSAPPSFSSLCSCVASLQEYLHQRCSAPLSKKRKCQPLHRQQPVVSTETAAWQRALLPGGWDEAQQPHTDQHGTEAAAEVEPEPRASSSEAAEPQEKAAAALKDSILDPPLLEPSQSSTLLTDSSSSRPAPDATTPPPSSGEAGQSQDVVAEERQPDPSACPSSPPHLQPSVGVWDQSWGGSADHTSNPDPSDSDTPEETHHPPPPTSSLIVPDPPVVHEADGVSGEEPPLVPDPGLDPDPPTGHPVMADQTKSEDVSDDFLSAPSASPLPSSSSSSSPPTSASLSDIYADPPNGTEPNGSPVHGSSQKESVFMRLNNRIKALEMNMSLSGRYLEQLSQR